MHVIRGEHARKSGAVTRFLTDPPFLGSLMKRAFVVATVVMFAGAAVETARASTIEFQGTTVELLVDLAVESALHPGFIASATQVGFNGILGAGSCCASFNPLVVDGVTFSTPTPGAFVNVTTAGFYSPNNYPADFIVDSANPSSTQTLDISFPGTHFFLLDFGGLFNGGANTIVLSDRSAFSEASSPTVGNTELRGFFSTDLITSLQLTFPNDNWLVEDFTLTTPAPVPEPATLFLLASGLGLAAVRRKCRK